MPFSSRLLTSRVSSSSASSYSSSSRRTAVASAAEPATRRLRWSSAAGRLTRGGKSDRLHGLTLDKLGHVAGLERLKDALAGPTRPVQLTDLPGDLRRERWHPELVRIGN